MTIPLHGSSDADLLRRISAIEARQRVLYEVNETAIAGISAPAHTHTINGDTTWNTINRSLPYGHTIHDVSADTLIGITWRNMHLRGYWNDHAIPGFTEASGRAWFHGRDVGSSSVRLGNSVDHVRTISGGNLIDDPSNARMNIDFSRGSNFLDVEGHLTINSASNNNTTGQFPANFELVVRVWNLT